MKLPRTLRIGGKRIALRVIKDLEDWGQYDHDGECINLDRDLLEDPEKLRVILRHEMVHASLAIGGVAFAQIMDEEPIVRCLDEIFFPAWEALETKMSKS